MDQSKNRGPSFFPIGYKVGRRSTWFLFMLPGLIVYIAFMAFPLLNSMRLSFYTGVGLTPDRFIGFGNYVELFTNPLWRDRFFGAFINTCRFFFIHMAVQNTLGLLFATLLSSSFKGRDIFRAIIFAPTTLSTMVIGFLWTLILNPQWGMFNKLLEAIGLGSLARPWLGDANLALPVISLVSCWQWIGIPTMTFLAGLLNISDELIESARVDGASSWQLFWKIKIPLLLPSIGIVSVLTFIGNFNAFDIVFAMASHRGDPMYATDILGTFFYRTAIAGEHPVARPDMGIGASVATIIFLVLSAGVAAWLASLSRRYTYEI